MVLGSRQRDSVQPGDVQDPIQDELHRDRGEQEAHHPTDSASAGASESPEDSVRIVKQDERDEDCHEDPGEDEQLVRRIVDRMGHVDHDGRDRPGAREERDAEGHDGDLIPLERLLPLLCCQPRAGALASEHLERDAKEDDPARDLEGGNREPERGEDPLAEDREDAEGDRRREARFRDDVLFLRGGQVFREDREERDDPEGVDDRDRSNSSQVMTWSFSLPPFVNRSVFVPRTLLGWRPFTAAICRAYSNEICLSAGMFHPFVAPPYGGVLTAVRQQCYKCLSFV